MIAAAGTGGHVFPGLSVGEALVSAGIPRSSVLFVGGDRLAADVYPKEGFDFLGLELRGLQRSLTMKNLALPGVVRRARREIVDAIGTREVRVVLAMGGYVTVPAGLAAKKTRVPLFHAEQNAEAGLANRLVARWAHRSFVAFPETVGLEQGEWVGNPVREPFWSFDRNSLALAGFQKYDLDPNRPILGVFGGSLGAGSLNEAVVKTVAGWTGSPFQIVHLTGERDFESLIDHEAAESVAWRKVAFEESMETFYAVCDLVLARAGGSVAELTATATPSILVPGQFGSGGHQSGNAAFLTRMGAAKTLPESELADLPRLIESTLFDQGVLVEMRAASELIAKPGAAMTIAQAMRDVAG